MFVTTLTSQLYDAALALVYPQACAVCGASVESRHDGVACEMCWNATHLFREDDTLCWKCGLFTAASIADDKREAVRCGGCPAAALHPPAGPRLYEVDPL